MTRYDARFYTNKGIEISNKKIECTLANIPDMLAGIVLDYLKDAPYQSTIKARVTGGRHYTEYMLMMENNAVDVYCRVLRGDRAEIQKQSGCPSGSKRLPDKEESA